MRHAARLLSCLPGPCLPCACLCAAVRRFRFALRSVVPAVRPAGGCRGPELPCLPSLSPFQPREFQLLDDQLLDLVENWELVQGTGLLQVGGGCWAGMMQAPRIRAAPLPAQSLDHWTAPGAAASAAGWWCRSRTTPTKRCRQLRPSSAASGGGTCTRCCPCCSHFLHLFLALGVDHWVCWVAASPCPVPLAWPGAVATCMATGAMSLLLLRARQHRLEHSWRLVTAVALQYVTDALVPPDVVDRKQWRPPTAEDIVSCYHGSDVRLRPEDIILQVGGGWCLFVAWRPGYGGSGQRT